MQGRAGVSEAEVEFLAEEEMVSIVPNFNQLPIRLISGEVGPFRPQIPIRVPLWLAMALKKRQKCTIQMPEWMSVDSLTRVLQEERENDAFQPLPFHYIETGQLLLDSQAYGADMKDLYQVRALFEDVKNIRFNKIESGLSSIEGKTNAVKLVNLSAMEVNRVRVFFKSSLKSFFRYDPSEAEADVPKL